MILDEIKEALIEGNKEKVKSCVRQALDAGLAPSAIINDGLISGMQVIGVRFRNEEIFMPEVLVAANAMQAGMNIVKPLLIGDVEIASKGTVVMGTVKGDLHDIGKNLVIIMLQGSGFNVIDLGVDAAAEKFVEAVKQHRPQVVGLSALLTTTMAQMKRTVEALKQSGVKVMIGGAPITKKFADDIGADGYAPDAVTAVDLTRELLGLG
ncbi:Cobalamin (vitamin B12)-binding domain protein [Acididesulfobacillus acetoxydans]|uniref:Cobalamin (Vitamin B12)-binding domain protein n=1 Tax=Acididesulfobacillus acetoxydans TaxID=1561005 RepID=A0A8S0X0K3_9FIRM|nr:corrinoid protein [Acididesulfobacillus acetoxydans]CAA7602631.1 Cobalamin (vitamin B12)-binding domain protein [Acididesulfobacillus acetoxydans]CEJ09172.1 Dimethylamine corrinoid protein 2 [Acididesulfobacillus acetoxydans]